MHDKSTLTFPHKVAIFHQLFPFTYFFKLLKKVQMYAKILSKNTINDAKSSVNMNNPFVLDII